MANIVDKKEKKEIKKWVSELNTKNLFLKVRGDDDWDLRVELIDNSINKFPVYIANDFMKIEIEFLTKGYDGVIQLINDPSWKYRVEKNRNEVLIFLDEYIKIKLYKEQNDEFQTVINNVFNFIKNGLYFNYRYTYYCTPSYSKNIKVKKLMTRHQEYAGLDKMLKEFILIERESSYTDFYWEIKNNTFKLNVAEAFFQESETIFGKKYYIDVYEIEVIEVFTRNLNLNIPNINTPFEVLRAAEKINSKLLKLPYETKRNMEGAIKNTLKNAYFEAIVVYKDTFNKKIYILIMLPDFLSLLFDFYIPFIACSINRGSKLYAELEDSEIGDRVNHILCKNKEFLNYIVQKFLYWRFP